VDTLTTATELANPAEFQLEAVHTRPHAAPRFTGHWVQPNQPAPDPRVSLRLHLRPEPHGRISILLTADDPRTYGCRHQLAAWHHLPTRSWTRAVAPTVTAHRWVAHTRHRTRRDSFGDKLLRAALAHILAR
jgi:hypothetical protein